MNRIPTALLIAGLALPSLTALAQPTIDGVVDESYGEPIVVQTIQTQFGDVIDPLLGQNGSELNAAFAQFDETNLYLAFTGNLEPNFNKLIVFFDSVSGGSQAIDPANNPSNFDSRIGNGNANGWEALGPQTTVDETTQEETTTPGLVFDAGFEPDYALLFRRGGDTFDVDYAQMNQTDIPADEFGDIYLSLNNSNDPAISIFGPQVGVNHSFEFGHNDTNVGGVTGGTQLADTDAAAAATTGTEISIPLAALGNPTGDVKVTAFIASGSFDFFSNQFLSPLEVEDFDEDPETPADRPNLGDFKDLSVLPGEQFFTISLGGVAALAGDFNGNGAVEQGDLDLVLGNWGSATTPPGFVANTEGLADGVDQEELDAVLGNWGASTAPSQTAVPEPATAILLGLGGLSLLRRRSA